MKVSRLIDILQKVQAANGDIDVEFHDKTYGRKMPINSGSHDNHLGTYYLSNVLGYFSN